MSLELKELSDLCRKAEHKIRKNGYLIQESGSDLVWDYAMYRLGDISFHAIGITWQSDISGHLYSAKYDVNSKEITDYYIIFPKGGEYFSAQIDPISKEHIALYRNEGTHEPKIEVKTGDILQHNTYGAWYDLPKIWQDSLREAKFNYFDKIYCYAEKPYGKCVEFNISSIFGIRSIESDSWFYLPFVKGEINTAKIDYYENRGYALFYTGLNDREVWMSNRKEQVLEMLDQVENSYGRVLCSGLGLGIIPLLIAEQPHVQSVTVIENNVDIISLFNKQGFISPKISVIQGDILTHAGGSYDSIMLDHYNSLGDSPWDFMIDMSQHIRNNTNSQNAIVIPYAWQRVYVNNDSVNLSMKAIGMPNWEFNRISRYLNHNQDTSSISNLLFEINRKRIK